jgi:hypothetical protein
LSRALSSTQSVEVHEEGVPRALFFIAVAESFESEVCRSPGEGIDKFFVRAENIDGSTNICAATIGFEETSSIIVAVNCVEVAGIGGILEDCRSCLRR